MSKQTKIEEIMDLVKGQEPEQDIPIELWVTDPAEVARRLNASARKMGFAERFSADEVKRFKE